MNAPDLNLLYVLEALLLEGSVIGAAKRLRLSSSATSRALARLREAVGDPLLVRSGRHLIPTPRAELLRQSISEWVQGSVALLTPERELDKAGLQRTFTLRTSDGFAENFGPALLARLQKEAPKVRLHFVQKDNKQSLPLRSGQVDLETAVIGAETRPELRVKGLFQDRMVAVVRQNHPLARDPLTLSGYTSAQHIQVARLGESANVLDESLQSLGLQRNIAITVGGFAAALSLASTSDLMASVPEKHTGFLRKGLTTLPLPFAVQGFTVSMLWHPRLDADPAHRWLRACLVEVCREAPSPG
ncbi:MAG: LysR family transcriptional regulator [Acidobacteria bacterium]|nr:LysR family transcriptional regulator [Acidobacteriota bacterium]MCB9397891.1 LysR family transcriptional regulator [Acidobacteriota bacterium]